MRADPPPLQQPEFLKWRHWRPGRIKEMEPTTQRALELHLRGKWAERLLARLVPFAERIPYINCCADVSAAQVVDESLTGSFGWRWRTASGIGTRGLCG